MKVTRVFLDPWKILANQYQLAESTAFRGPICPHSEGLTSPATFVSAGRSKGNTFSQL